MTETFPVTEIFGPTIQGEGAMIGTVTHFVRFGGCDYRCAWCDSAHAVLPEQVRLAERLTSLDIVHRLEELPYAQWVTLSGGNPALLELNDFILLALPLGFRFAAETQGTLWKDWLQYLDFLTVSPKGPSSGNETPLEVTQAFVEKVQVFFAEDSWCLKVVVFNTKDYEYARKLREVFTEVPFFLSVGTFMGGLRGTFAGGTIDSRDTLLGRLQWLAEKAGRDSVFAGSGVRVLPQLHALIWGHGRGF